MLATCRFSHRSTARFPNPLGSLARWGLDLGRGSTATGKCASQADDRREWFEVDFGATIAHPRDLRMTELEQLIEQARHAAPNDRIELRDAIAAFGANAIELLAGWLLEPGLQSFAVRVIGRAADSGARDAAVSALLAARDESQLRLCADIDAELTRMGVARPGATDPATTSDTGRRFRRVSRRAFASRTGRGSDGLVALHERLAAHFSAVARDRERFGAGAPIFALEHGLSDEELDFLRTEVRAAVVGEGLPEGEWLPFIVYAAEIGYEYSGDEYWQTFEARTPGWSEWGDRPYIRQKFHLFRREFRGAEPTGVWAKQFSIISWPITHAVLPTDLQRHLARLLFDYRRGLTSDLLDQPAELGKRLTARAWQTSSRFQNFAQNTSLLGQVAVALLVGDESDSPLLLPATLQRIVSDLSVERDAWRLLRGAKSSASQVRLRGFQPEDHGRTGAAQANGERLPAAADPDISLRFDEEWTAYLEVPDLSTVGERLPAVQEEARTLRARVEGYDGPPLARGQLFYPGRLLKLGRWPRSDLPLIQLEDGSQAVNSLLADQCVLSPGPVWLFRIRGESRATEVRGKFIRPGHSFVVLSTKPLPIELPRWVAVVESATHGVVAYDVRPPAVMQLEDISRIRSAGLGAQMDIEIRPAGLVPASWDGEGAAEWIAGDVPMLAVTSTRAIGKCVVAVNGQASLVDWPASEPEIFLRLTDLGIGAHRLHISMLLADSQEKTLEGWFDLIVRPPTSRPSSGTFREGIMLLSAPVNPSLTELWDNTATVDILGPQAATVTVTFSLADSSGSLLAQVRIDASLPVDRNQWASIVGRFREDDAVSGHYDAAEWGTITVSHPALGRVSLRCEREFSALRWIAGRDREGPYVRLINSTEAPATAGIWEYAVPDSRISIQVDAEERIRRPSGGLVTAHAGDVSASTILAPWIRRPADLETLRVRRMSKLRRAVPEIRSLIDLARQWAEASLPADPYAATGRIHVQQAIAAAIGGLVTGGRWATLEDRAADFGEIRFSEIASAIGDSRQQLALARALLRETETLLTLRPTQRARRLGRLLETHVPGTAINHARMSLSEFALRLASDPPLVATMPVEQLVIELEGLLASPVVFRAARFIVLQIHELEEADIGRTYRGWAWE